MPQDLLRAAGTSSIDDRLSLVMTRLRSSGTPPRADVETSLSRSFWLPTARTFSMIGSARISPLIPDDMIDRLVGRPGTSQGGVVAYSLGRLPGDLRAGAIATLDGNSSTLWEPGFGASHQAGQWLQYVLPRPITFDHLDLQIAADSQHSVPTVLTIAADGKSDTVTLPTVADSPVAGSVVDVPVSFPTLTGQSIRITVDDVRIENTPNYYSQTPIAMPIGIAEVGIPGLHAAPLPATIPSSCRDDLLTIQVDGTKGSAVAGLRHCWMQPYGGTPRPTWNPDVENPFDFFDQWQKMPEQKPMDNAFRRQWELFLRHVVKGEPFPWDLMEGAKGVQLAEKGLESWRKRAWVDAE